jgi:hypothetical protein
MSWFMGMIKVFEFFAIVPKIPSPKHHKIQEFGQNYDISAMKINKMFVFKYFHNLVPQRY